MDTGAPIIWTDEAKEDLRDVLHYLSRSPLAYVDNWSNELTKKLSLLESFPEMGRKVPEKELSHLREILVGNYRLLYIPTRYDNNYWR
ncbi:type II toxin-antitoxin system RelE/ParE family toxin [Spirosoma endbachense]|uniref:Type II toxin-antitoxin system RelE/ParE family toxin n=1 Tax=Spirosoma endbachense TaxID=2666025 RepID=A0A6P1VYU3_9BACT|nr:type II toxin-antitoxin system RelE/ParE family toxin [Spirosoma endbachense]